MKTYEWQTGFYLLKFCEGILSNPEYRKTGIAYSFSQYHSVVENTPLNVVHFTIKMVVLSLLESNTNWYCFLKNHSS